MGNEGKEKTQTCADLRQSKSAGHTRSYNERVDHLGVVAGDVLGGEGDAFLD